MGVLLQAHNHFLMDLFLSTFLVHVGQVRNDPTRASAKYESRTKPAHIVVVPRLNVLTSF